MALAPGTRLGVYEVISPIGEGGMGQVLRARDTKLNREVALKILPDAFANDPDRIARFTREAQTLAALNHPNIAHIHGLEESDGMVALIMELVEGEDLSALIARGQPDAESGSSRLRDGASAARHGGGPPSPGVKPGSGERGRSLGGGPAPRGLSIDDCVRIAKQIADALEAAHEQGIIHRDLKPANIKVRPDGTVKVLDFGLAKAMERIGAMSASASMSPTLTTPAMTQAGMILGTAAYMSPEQARGKTVDRRADIWAFGAVLFEMLTGTRAFPGEDITDTLAAVVRAEPEWSLVPGTVSPTLLVFLRRCLRKDPRQRIADIHDVRLALDGAFDALSEPAKPGGAPVVSRTRERVAWAALGIVSLVALAVTAFAFLREAPAELRPMRFFVSPPDGWRVTTALNPGGSSPAPLAVSPDGSRIAFVANTETGRSQLLVRALDTLAARALAGTDGAASPFWSPDSRSVAFFADGKLKKIDVSGGPAVVLCDSRDNVGGTWNRDGVIVFSPGTTSALQKVSASGGVPSAATVLANGENYHGRPSFLPDGRHFLYRVGNGGIYVTSLDSTARTLILPNPDSTNVVYAGGRLLFLRETTLMAQPFDLGRLTLTGDPVPIAEQIQTTANNPNGLFSASDTGLLVYQTGIASASNRQLTWFDRAGKAIGTVEKPGLYNTVALSPDGTRVAVSRNDFAVRAGQSATGNTDLWVHEFARNTTARLTFDPGVDWLAAWSPDGRHLAWSGSRDGGVYELIQKMSSGAGTDEPLLKSSDATFLYDWSPDRRFLLYGVSSPNYSLWVQPTGDDRPPTSSRRPESAEGPKPTLYLEQTGFNVSQARFSPDGRYVAYTSNASGRNEVYVRPFPAAAEGQWMASQGGGNQPHWRRNGKELFYISADSKLMSVPVATSPTFTPGVPTALFPVPIWGGASTQNVTRYDVTPDGQKFLVNSLLPETTTSLPAPITVVLNWTAGLKK